jgi:hypothetical protein
MTHYDVCNGDADGLCSLQQLRLADPRETLLVTGIKRDIALLARVPAGRGDTVTVLDVSLDVNRDALAGLLARGAAVRYFDHHYAGAIPAHPALEAHIDAAPDVCTGIVVDRYLRGRHRAWAVVAAFGDNLVAPARALAAAMGLAPDAEAALRALGDALTYAAYGDREEDVLVAPSELAALLRPYADPLRFVRDEPAFRRIAEGRDADLALARAVPVEPVSPSAAVAVLPDAAWSRRARGALGNELAMASPARAHAILVPNALGGYTVSVRAPLARRTGADALCRSFATGGGRAAAAGINHLPAAQVPDFLRRFARAFAGTPDG